MSPDVRAAIARIRDTWDNVTLPSALQAGVAAVALALLGGAHVARIGTPAARLAGLLTLTILLVSFAALHLARVRRDRDPRAILLRTIGQADPSVARRTVRALDLAQRTQRDAVGTSMELANLHLWRLLSRAPLERVAEMAGGRARRLSLLGLVLGVACVALVAPQPLRIIEGFDVMAAQDGIAPVNIQYLDEVSVSASPPAYLKLGEQYVLPFREAEQPKGSTLTVRGRPTQSGRSLVLSDGTTTIPFADDGRGGLIAHWTIEHTGDIHIGARFGEVFILQADTQPVTSIADEVPVVKLEGAPRTAHIMDEPRIELRYKASDDHGLREITLVMRAAGREERRVLSRPNTDLKTESGGHQLDREELFIEESLVPIEVTIEARDNDEVSGPKWGRSAPIMVVPPQIGEAEALRFASLVSVRDALTDLTAERLRMDPPRGKVVDHLNKERAAQQRAIAVAEKALAKEFGGLEIDGPMEQLARGQMRRLQDALAKEAKAPSALTHDELVDVTEQVLLALDAGMSALAFRDAQAVSRRLAMVATEAAEAARLLDEGTEIVRGEARLSAATGVLDQGGVHLSTLGVLGADLGEIVENGLRRIARAEGAGDHRQAELAARDLAARLTDARSSFGGGGRGGVESGGTPNPTEGDSSAADDEVKKALQELRELIYDHKKSMQEVSKALDDARRTEDLDALRDELDEHAKNIRNAARRLPAHRTRSDSPQTMSADARRQAEAMAEALERASLRDAVGNGDEAVASLEKAQALAREGTMHDHQVGQNAQKVQTELEKELAWAKQALKKLRDLASERVEDELESAAKEEGALAERAEELSERGETGEAAKTMRKGRGELQAGDGTEALELLNQAQRMLEMAMGRQDSPGRKKTGQEGPRGEPGGDSEVPGAEDHKGPAAFRKRVMDGLGQASDPRLSEAVKRYAEGLLK